MSLEPFFYSRDGLYEATPACRGPWDPTSLHGADVVALLGYEIDRAFG